MWATEPCWCPILGADWESIIDLLKAAKASAEAIQGWFDAAPGNLSTAIADCQRTTDAWFSGEETAAHNAIANLETTIEDETFGNAAPLPPMSSDTESSRDERKLSKAIRDLSYIVKVINGHTGQVADGQVPLLHALQRLRSPGLAGHVAAGAQ